MNLFARTFVSRVRHPDRFAARAGPERRKVRPRSSGQTLMMRADPRCLPTRAAETAGVLAGNRQGAPGRSSGGMGHAHPSRRPARGCAARVRAGGTPVYGRPRAAASWLRPVKKTAIPAMADRVPMRTAAARHKPSAPGSRTRRESPMKSGSPRSSVMERRSCCAVRPESGGDAPPGCPPRYGSLRDRPRRMFGAHGASLPVRTGFLGMPVQSGRLAAVSRRWCRVREGEPCLDDYALLLPCWQRISPRSETR